LSYYAIFDWELKEALFLLAATTNNRFIYALRSLTTLTPMM